MNDLPFTDVMKLIKLIQDGIDDYDLVMDNSMYISLRVEKQDRKLLEKIVLNEDGG